MIRQLAPLAGILLLSGCALFGRDGIEREFGAVGDPYVAANLEILSLATTKKTIGDHIAGWITGKDCSLPRAEREGVWCVDWPGPPPPPPQVYCYASLGKPSCFAQPYNEGNDRLIGFVPAPTPIR